MAEAGDVELFAVYREDLDRLSRWIRRTGAGQTLTVLARRFTRGRLRYGPVSDKTPLPASDAPEIVRLWDPAKAWHEGDWAIFATSRASGRDQGSRPCFGEVVRVHGASVRVRRDGQPDTQVYGTTTTRGAGDAVDRWRSSIEALVTAARDRAARAEPADGGGDGDEAARIDYTLWIQGESIFGALLAALRHDPRFMVLEGRWFLRSLATRPSRLQMEGLARRLLVDVERPLTVDEMLPLVPPPVAAGDAGRYGLSLALGECPDLFACVVPGSWSRWVLHHPPDGTYTARLAAYDPESGVVLCEPGEVLERGIVERLWTLDLLRAVLAR